MTMPTIAELTRDILLTLLPKSGVREWDDVESRASIVEAAYEMAWNILHGLSGPNTMALPDVFLS